MIAICNRLLVKEGAAGQIVERFANSRGNVQGFPCFVSKEVLCSERGPNGEDEVLVITCWRGRGTFDAWGWERRVLYTVRTSSASPHSHGRKVKDDAAVLRTCCETYLCHGARDTLDRHLELDESDTIGSAVPRCNSR